MREQFKQGFSLMEMMVVLLIVAIIAAATAPMVSKKMARNAGSGDSPWVFTGLNNSIAYNMNGDDNSSVIIGTSRLPNGWNQRVRLYIDSGNNAAHIAFGRRNNEPFLLTADPANGRVGFSNQEIPNQSIAMGAGQEINANSTGSIAIGQGATINGAESIAIGYNVEATATNTIAIGSPGAAETEDEESVTRATVPESLALGFGAQALGPDAIAIGTRAVASGANAGGRIAIGLSAEANSTSATALGTRANASNMLSLALGTETEAQGLNSIAIGSRAIAGHDNSVAIGAEAETTTTNQIVLGRTSDTVYIPGNLVVGGNAYIGTRITPAKYYNEDDISGEGTSLFLKLSNGKIRAVREYANNSNGLTFGASINYNSVTLDKAYTSDRRLKNVGEKYTAGLAELKQLDFFHYTFKKDEKKIPHVGVIAQDLQKVFPDAVTKGEDGYLRIRFEDMFYAVINAVKELDNKITEIVENITGIQKTIETQQEIIEELQKQNKEILKQNEELQKRIEKLEKNK